LDQGRFFAGQVSTNLQARKQGFVTVHRFLLQMTFTKHATDFQFRG
jgi:hypothetical protein